MPDRRNRYPDNWAETAELVLVLIAIAVAFLIFGWSFVQY